MSRKKILSYHLCYKNDKINDTINDKIKINNYDYIVNKFVDKEYKIVYNFLKKGVDNMAQTSINIRMDEELKKQFDAFCSEIGMNMTTAFCVFAKKAVRERRIPFEISADPFYSEENMTRLRESIRKVEAGEKSLTEHELIEV